MRVLGRLFVCGVLGVAALTALPAAQTPILPVLDHIHLNVPDQAKAVEWYQKNFGGQSMTEAPDRLMLGETRLIFLRNANGLPSTGSALDHLGFSFADLDAKMKELEVRRRQGGDAHTRSRRLVQTGLRRRPVGHENRAGAGSRTSWACIMSICARPTRRRRSPGTRRSLAEKPGS